MKKGYHHSRSSSQEHQKYYHQKSPNRSRQKKSNKNQNWHKVGFTKIQSDIKNHFRFRLPNITQKEEQDTIASLRKKLNQCIGPVQHITFSRQTMMLNLGFKYDIDAISFQQRGSLSIKISGRQLELQSAPTKAFSNLNKYRSIQNDQKIQKNMYNKRKSDSSRKKMRSISSSSSSKRSNSNESRPAPTIKLQIYGIPFYIGSNKVLTILNQGPGGPYQISKCNWRKLDSSICQCLQLRINSQQADRLLQQSSKIQVGGRPVIIIEESQRPKKSLLGYQIVLQFPKPVYPSKILKNLQTQTRVVQIVANQQIQQDGKCKSFTITLNDQIIAGQFKKLEDLNCGILVSQPKNGQLVYRPIQLLPSRHQL